MAIEFVIEDGTGKSTATSYVTKAELIQYWENFGTDYSALTDDAAQVLLNSATRAIDEAGIYAGQIIDADQALQFPRYGIWDRNEANLSGTVPEAIKKAVCEMAKYINDGNNPAPVIGNIASRSMGPVSVTFKGSQQAPIITRLSKLISQFFKQTEVLR